MELLKAFVEAVMDGEKTENESNLLEYMVKCYLEEKPISSPQIKKIEEEMSPYYEDVSFEASEKLFRLVYDLCGSYEEAAFREGVLVGLRLQKEVEKLCI